MKITQGTYENASEVGYSGWIEGVREDGSSWIMYLDQNGSPTEFFAHRDESGAVSSEPIALQ